MDFVWRRHLHDEVGVLRMAMNLASIDRPRMVW
jgi:hypothetical protein